MRIYWATIIILITGLSMTGCSIVSPINGGLYTEVKWSDMPPPTTPQREGKACAQGILGVATGEATIEKAKVSSGITQVLQVEHTAKNVLGVYAEWCTIVKGS
jgi:hypothetical protein